jgi:NADH-quinone oxidoreductase subunit D
VRARRGGRQPVRDPAARQPDLAGAHDRHRHDHHRGGARAHVEFDVVYTENGDCYDRFLIRLYEILESVRIVRQCVERMPKGDYRVQDRKITPPPRARIDESMEALIHHFKLFTEGFKVPAGETYVAIESPRGEIGCYLVSDGTGKPARLHIRGPSFYNLQSMEAMVPGTLMADAVAIISSVDPVMGEVDR